MANKNNKSNTQQLPAQPIQQQPETQVKSDFLQAFDTFMESFNTFNNQNQSPSLVYDFNAFNKATTNRTHDSIGSKYTKDQTRGYLAKPERFEKQIRDSSIYLYSSVHEYKHLIHYMSHMLTHDYILIPDNNLNKTINDKKLLSSFYDNLEFIENYNVKEKLSAIETILVREDFYFGYERSDGDNYIWQRLPSDSCRLLGWDEFGCLTFEFDFSYFNKNGLALENFDSEFKTKFDSYKNNSKERWQQLSDNAICFKFDTSVLYGLPYFSGLFTDLMGLEDYKDDQEDSNRANNYKLISLQIPVWDKDKGVNQYLVSLDHVANFVSNAQRNTPTKFGIFASPMKTEVLNLNKSEFEENIVSKAQNDLMTSAGVSKLIGNGGDTSMGLERSIQDDETVMFGLLRQYELWFKKRLRMFNGDKYRWKIFMPDISIYNKKEMFEMYLKSSNAGMPKSPLIASMNMSQADFISLANLENNQLNIVEELLVVLPSAATTSGNDEGGRPGKAVLDKKDISLKADEANKSKTFEDDEDGEEVEIELK